MSSLNTTAYLGPVFNSLYAFDGRKLPTDYELLREYATNDIVYACVNYNANSVAQVPLRLYTAGSSGKSVRSHASRRASRLTKARLRKNPNLQKMIGPGDDVTEITEHPLLDLLYQDNDGLNGFQFFRLTQTYQEILGRAYWRKENVGITGRPTSLYMLKPQRTQPIRSIDGDVLGYKNQPDLRGVWVDLPPDEVVEFLDPHTEDPYGWGMSPLKAAYLQSLLTTKFTQFGNDLMDNRARIDGMFIPADDTSPEMARKAEEQFTQRYANRRNGGVWFSPTKGTFVPTRYAPTDLGPMEVDKNTTSRLCRAFGIPEPLMSANESTFSNMDKALQFHAKFATTPRVLMMEQRINAALAPLFDERLFIAADNPVPEDNEFELKKTQVAITASALTKNEIREMAGYEEMSGEGMDDVPSDEPPEADQTNTEEEPEPKGAPKDKDDDAKPATKAVIDTDKILSINKAVVSGEMPRSVAISTLSKSFDITEEEAKTLVGFREEEPVEKAVGDLVNPPDNEEEMKRNRRERALLLLLLGFWMDQRQDILASIDPQKHAPIQVKPQWNAKLSSALLGGMMPAAFDSAQDTMASIGAAAEKTREVNAIIHDRLQTIADEHAALINQTTVDRVNGALGGVVEGSDNAEDLYRTAVSTVFDEAQARRSNVIADDSVYMAGEIGLSAAAQVAQIELMWRCKEDERVCGVCGDLEGVVVKAGEEFAPGIRYPVADTHVMCRCKLVPITRDPAPPITE